jgi:hypothetical protein
LHTGEQQESHGTVATSLANQFPTALSRQAGLVFTQELTILLSEPVPEPTRLLQFPFEPALALPGSLLAGTASTAPGNPGQQSRNPTECTDRGHDSP